MHLFYTPDISTDNYTLNEEESKHCIRVLRLSLGDTINLIDGRGGFYTAEISDVNPKKCCVKITNIINEYGKKEFYLHIAIAPTKNNDRFEWFLEKTTEIGIDEITPIVSFHSERKVIKKERLNKVITSATKQSLKAYHPTLNDVNKFTDFIKKDFNGEKYIAHCNQGDKVLLKNIYNKSKNALILIGPEGDFSVEEVEMAKANGFIEISLGNSRLRTETAGIVACHTISIIND